MWSIRCTITPKAKRVIFLYQAGGPSHLETFDFKPKLAEMHGKAMPESLTKGQQIAQLQGRPLVCFGPQHKFQKFGKSGQEICESVPAHRQCCRRCLHRPLDVDRADQSRSGAHVDEHRLDHRGPAEHGLVGAVWAGRGDGESAGLRRAYFGGQGRTDAADRGAPMVGGHFAEPVSGREVQLDRRSGAAHSKPRRRDARRSRRKTRSRRSTR